MEVLTSTLRDRALDWAVAKSDGWEIDTKVALKLKAWHKYSTDWLRSGPILDRERLEFRQANTGMLASYPGGPTWFGRNHIEAGLRCFVGTRQGAVMDIPDEILIESRMWDGVYKNVVDLPSAVGEIAKAWNKEQFTSGGCHSLAEGLYLANARQGSLAACLRKEINPDGSVFSTTYSHMVYADVEDVCWDIDGRGADVRWQEQWPDADVPDKDDLTVQFEWVDIDHSKLHTWLLEHKAVVNRMLVDQIAQLARAFPAPKFPPDPGPSLRVERQAAP